MSHVRLEKIADALRLTLTTTGRQFLQEQIAAGRSVAADSVMYELLEDHLSSGWDWIRPEEIGALTNAPILSDDCTRDDQGLLEDVGDVYWFDRYQIESPDEELLRRGHVEFRKADSASSRPETARHRSRPNYPATVAEVLNPPVKFRSSVVETVTKFAGTKPFRGTQKEREVKFRSLHNELCRIYGRTTGLVLGLMDGTSSGSSFYRPATDEITLNGKLSVVTYLHEFAHALGRDERGAVRWSVNLFRQCFPRSYARCLTDGHMLRRGTP